MKSKKEYMTCGCKVNAIVYREIERKTIPRHEMSLLEILKYGFQTSYLDKFFTTEPSAYTDK